MSRRAGGLGFDPRVSPTLSSQVYSMSGWRVAALGFAGATDSLFRGDGATLIKHDRLVPPPVRPEESRVRGLEARTRPPETRTWGPGSVANGSSGSRTGGLFEGDRWLLGTVAGKAGGGPHLSLFPDVRARSATGLGDHLQQGLAPLPGSERGDDPSGVACGQASSLARGRRRLPRSAAPRPTSGSTGPSHSCQRAPCLEYPGFARYIANHPEYRLGKGSRPEPGIVINGTERTLGERPARLEPPATGGKTGAYVQPKKNPRQREVDRHT